MLKARDIFLKVFESVDSLNSFNTESESENVIKRLLMSQVLISSKTSSTDLTSAG